MFQMPCLKAPWTYGSASNFIFHSQARKYQNFPQLKVDLRIRALKIQCFLPSVQHVFTIIPIRHKKPCVRLDLRTPFPGR